MLNQEIADIFYEIADILEMLGVDWKPAAYRKAARSLENFSGDLKELFEKQGVKGLKNLSGVGDALAKKIAEYIETGKIKGFEKLKKQIPKGMEDLMEIEGLGPKKIAVLNKKLRIKDIKDLKEAIKKGKIAKLERFGTKSQENIAKSVDMFDVRKERFLLDEATLSADYVVESLKKLKEIKKIIVAGSFRRKKETVGDLDILVISRSPALVMDRFTKLGEVKRVLAKGATKSMIVLKNNLQVDIRVVEEKSFGAALNYFTGSKDHNIALRQISIKKGYKLSEYGLFNRKTNKQVGGATEQDLYKKLGMHYIEPELRENTGEIEASIKNKLPKLVGYGEIKGDLQMHTRYSDGSDSVEEMALAAKKLGYEYIAITDHSKSSKIANGIEEKRLLKQIEEIDKLNKKLNSIKILKSAEIDILREGNLDYGRNILKKLDIVMVAVHSGFKMPEKEMTSRIVKALENEYVNILSHPTGRLINKRAPYNADLDKIFDAAKRNKVILEINSDPARLDLNDVNARAALKHGVKLSLGTDAHSTEALANMEFGIATARRAWADKKDVVNTLPLKELLKILKK